MKWIYALLALCISLTAFAQSIPLPEHPRPDFERKNWLNLNGNWDFEFDSLNVGISKNWQQGTTSFSKKIKVPFPWGSQLSEVKDEADYGWYKRSITVPSSWKNQRTFITIGASDWETSVWLDGTLLGTHQGGYTPFSFELTPYLKYDNAQQLVIRVDDKRRDFTLYGKQGYGNARGIWQTVYLEARGNTYLDAVHFTPDIDKQLVKVTAYLPEESATDAKITVRIQTPNGEIVATNSIPKGKDKATFDIALPNPRLWTLEDPYLYQAEVRLNETDVVQTYFGMRKISVVPLPGTNYPYIALNNEPIYLQLTLDQSYHPEGFYTFPSDAFMKNEIQLCKDIGLNGLRTHIKVDVPRKLYWADKLGLLIMSDLPNSWGEPDEKMQAELEYTLREMIKRDYNHPAIFSWITFNETWGLRTKVTADGKTADIYLPETQHWVASMYYLAKSLDPTRLIEDNSICCGRGHTETDINSWHEYLPGWAWEEHLSNIDKNTFEGSTHHFENGFKQNNQPNINSECGNVWGYDGSTGDVDWSYDYHRMMNTFRKYPKVAGWLYTEHHDVINEWNGYWRFDRTKKFTGLEELVPGMTDQDFHSAFYISTENNVSKTVNGGVNFEVPLYLSVMSGKSLKNNQLILEYETNFLDKTGTTQVIGTNKITIPYQAWMQQQLNPITIKTPEEAGLGMIKLTLKDVDNKVLHHNFMHFIVKSAQNKPNVTILEVKPSDYKKAKWSQKSWNVLDGLKVNGAGKGYFEYQIPITKSVNVTKAKEAYILFEASAKQLFDKDRSEDFDKN